MNKPKKNCNLCDKDISYAGWSQHTKSKGHIKKVEKEKQKKVIINNKDELLRM